MCNYMADGWSVEHPVNQPLTNQPMDIRAMGEVLLYGALFFGICLLLATRALEPIEVIEEEEMEALPVRYPRSRRKRKKITRYYL